MFQANPGNRGHAHLVRALLLCSSLTAMGFAATSAQAADPTGAFLKKYNACDAQILANYWHVGFVAAKVTGGQKILDGNNGLLKHQLETARGQSQCNFEDTGFSFNDAVKLAKFWGKSVGDAKSKVVAYFSEGRELVAKNMLKMAKG